MIVTARVERIGDTETYRVVINHDGKVLVDGESFEFCARLAQSLVRPDTHVEGILRRAPVTFPVHEAKR